MSRFALAALLALVLAAAGCGGDDGDSGGGGGGGGETASGPAKQFADTCGSCHTLAAAGTEGQVGPNLDELKPDAATVTTAIKEGPGIMPENLLTGADADSVAKYVADNAGK
jgi:mono/diheme cytochrome c family protein